MNRPPRAHTPYAWLFGSGNLKPQKTAVISFRRGQEEHLTFGELEQQARQLAGGLRRAGLHPRDRVLVLTTPGPDLFVALFGLLLGGMVPVLVDPGLGLGRMLDCARDAQVHGVISVRRAWPLRWLRPRAFRQVRVWVTTDGRLPGLPHLQDLLGNELSSFPQVTPDDTALIAFTSGSTGPPKGVELTYRNLRGTFDAFRLLLGSQEEGEVDMIALPALSLISAALGRTCLVPEIDFARLATVDVGHLLKDFQHHAVCTAFLSPILCSKIAEYTRRQPVQLPGTRVILTGGAPIPNPVSFAMTQLLPDGEFYTPYGATEVLPATIIGAREILEETAALTAQGKGVCVGRPLPQTEIRIMRPVDGPVPSEKDIQFLPPGEIGEIIIRAPQASPRYFGKARATRMAKIPCPDGGFWHRMGDLGYLDEQGRLWFCGRKKHQVQAAEQTYYPVCVEGIVNTLPFVRRSALVGVGQRGNQTPVLLIEPFGQPDPQQREAWRQQIMEILHEHRFRIQHVLFYPKAFPTDRRHNSKIERPDLARWAAKQRLA